jgi:AraC-like DNA-binding protein/mannose-6-phosphate isomerase-like protein (cupin superfamily)
MDRRLIRASERLSKTQITITADRYDIEVFWFRIMNKTGDWFIRRHAHSTYEFHFCAQGACMVETGTSSFMIKEGYFYLSPPGVYHSQRPANREEFIEYSLNCNIVQRPKGSKNPLGEELDQLFSVLTNSTSFPVADHYGVLALFNEALEEAERQRLGFEWALHSLVTRILVASARAIVLERAQDSSKPAPLAENRMTKIENYILAHIQKDISPRDLAEHLNLSEKQVSRIVLAHKGFSTKKFITRSKLNRAKEFLVSGDMPIKEIAAILGFSSEYYFSSVFKLHVGCPPGVFRSSMALDSKENVSMNNV